MSLLPALTKVGLLALQAAKAGGEPVVLTRIGLGSAPRLPTTDETDLVAPVVSAPITSHTLDSITGQLDLGVQIDGAAANLTEDHVIHEAGVFDQLGRLIYYWASPNSLGSITPVTAYALNVAVLLGQADAGVIQIVDQGPPWDAVIGQQIAALDARVRRASWRNLFLTQA